MLVGLGDNVVARTPACIGAAAMEDSADDGGRADLGPVEDCADHGGGGGLPVGTSDHHGVGFEPQQVCEQVASMNDGNPPSARGGGFWIAVTDGRRDDHDSGAAEMVFVVALEESQSKSLEAGGDVGGCQVRSRGLIAEIQEDLGEAAHTDPPHSDKMDSPSQTTDHVNATSPPRPAHLDPLRDLEVS